MTFRESLSVNPGATVVAFDFNPMSNGDANEPRIVEFSDMAGREKELEAAINRKLEATRKKKHPNAVLKTVDIAGAQVTVIAEDDSEKAKWIIGSVVVDGIQIESRDAETIEQAIGSVKSGGDSAKKVEQLSRIAELNGGTSDLTLLADLDSLIALLQKKLMESAGKESAMPFSPAIFLSVLGLEELKSLAVTLDFNDERSSGNMILLHTPKPQGILPVLMRGTSTEVPQLPFLPANADQASVSRQSFGNIYDALMGGLQKLGPMAAMLTMQLDQMEQKAGMSLRKDLFGSMDDVMAQAQTLKMDLGSEPKVSQVTAIKLKDAARFQSALNAVLAMAGNGFGVFEESEIEGQKVHTLKPSLAADAGAGAAKSSTQIAYAVTDEYLLFCQGSQDMLKNVLARLKTKDAAGSIWDDATAQAAIAALPKGYSGMAVSNGASLMKTVASLITQFQSMSGTGKPGAKSVAPRKGPKGAAPAGDGEKPAKAGDNGPSFDAKAMPGEEVFKKYFGQSASANYAESDATVVRMIALPPAK